MKTLLHIDSSPRAGRSHSRQPTVLIARAWRNVHQNGMVVHRELGLTPVPLVSEDWIAAAFSSPTDHTDAQRGPLQSRTNSLTNCSLPMKSSSGLPCITLA
jgi:FMN-dependent NADH-azoreductase